MWRGAYDKAVEYFQRAADSSNSTAPDDTGAQAADGALSPAGRLAAQEETGTGRFPSPRVASRDLGTIAHSRGGRLNGGIRNSLPGWIVTWRFTVGCSGFLNVSQ